MRVLLIGTGQYAGTSVTALRDRGAVDVAVFSVSGRAASFALRHGLTHETDLLTALQNADVVITCTAAELPVVTPEHLSPGRRRIVIDLGLPRNVDPAVARIEGVELLDLEVIGLHAPLEELNAADDARALVTEAASEFAAAATEQHVAPAIVAMREHVLGLLDQEIERAHARGDGEQTEAALRHLAGVFLHGPSVRARELARSGQADEFTAAVELLFAVTAANDDAAPAESDERRA